MRWPKNDIETWHSWFAWHPVQVRYPSIRMVWLEKVIRQFEIGPICACWKYRLPEEHERIDGKKS